MRKFKTGIMSLILCVVLTGCQMPATVTTVCRHTVLAQEAAALEQFSRKDVEIVMLRKGKKLHKQVRVRINGRWKYLNNSHRTYSFWNEPAKGFKIIK